MAPSTVFSYLRRDHRRPPSPTSHVPHPRSPSASNNPQSPSSPPKLPATAQTPTLTDSLLDSGLWTESEQNQQHVEKDTARLGRREDAERLAVPPARGLSPGTHSSRPNSSYDSRGGSRQSEGPGNNAQSPVILAPDHNEKPTSPWRLTFGKNNNPANGGKGGGAGYGKGKGSRDDPVATDPGDNARHNLHAPAASPLSPIPSSPGREGHAQEETTIPQHSRHGKTRLNLLNPLALLARRRSGQSLSSKSENVSVNRLGLPALPEDYDPRIRGKLVHDFSVPRTRAHGSSSNKQQQQEEQQQQQTDAPEQPAPSNDDTTDKGHESANGEQHRSGPRKQSEEESRLPEQEEDTKEPTIKEDSSENTGPTHQLEEGAHPSSSSGEGNQQERLAATAITPPTEGTAPTPSSFLSRSSTTRDPSSQATSSLPKHLHSSSSRFSFDMAGVESSSSQEKILEEKHKEKEAARRAKVQESHFYDSDSEDIDYGAMMDDDGLEERIPGVNAEIDEDDGDGGSLGHAHPSLMPTKPFVPVLPTLQSTPASPLDANPPTQPSPGGAENGSSPLSGPQTSTLNAAPVVQDTADISAAPQPQQQQPSPTNGKAQATQNLTEDDFYYDDGMFDDISEDLSGEGFDESIFDDETSHLYQRRNRDTNNTNVNDKPLPEHPVAGLGTRINNEENRIDNDDPGHGHPDRDDSQALEGQDLTEGNLRAYHSALADAANQAALKGRFRRSTNESEESVERQSLSQGADSQPDLTADQSGVSQNLDTVALEEDGLDDFDYNDARRMENDDDYAIIAAANAEVLEYDDEGYYGEEFGFYAHSHGPPDGEPVLGGYFGPRGFEGISRSHSGRANFQEPNLTPITERSEWSTRNSVISLTAAHQGTHSNPSVSSPPQLAQLVDMGNIEDEMSLAALRKLRREAFGGSNGSLRSSAASPTNASSSPQGQYQHHHHSSFGGSPSNSYDATAAATTGDQSLPTGGPVHSPNGTGDGKVSFPSEDGEDAGLALKYDVPLTGHGSGPAPLHVDTAKTRESGVSER